MFRSVDRSISMTARKSPEIVIPFLESAEPWRLTDAAKFRSIDKIDFEQRQLISWLSLPLASEVVNAGILNPLEVSVAEGGNNLYRTFYGEAQLDKQVAEMQRKTHTGSARPSFIHILLDPELPTELGVLVPTAQSKVRHLYFDLQAKVGTLNAKGEGSPTQTVAVKPKLTAAINRLSTGTTLEVPSRIKKAKTEPKSPLPIRVTHSKRASSTGDHHQSWRG